LKLLITEIPGDDNHLDRFAGLSVGAWEILSAIQLVGTCIYLI